MANEVSIKIVADSSGLLKAFDEARKSVTVTAAALNAMGSQTGKAFDSAGINAASAAIAKVREELRLGAANAQAFAQASGLLNAQLKQGSISKAEYTAALGKMRTEFGATTTQAGKMGEGVRSISEQMSGFKNLVLGAFGAGQVIEFGKALLDASLAADRLNKTLSFAVGSKTGAAGEIAYLTELSQNLGLNFAQTADAYAKFSASAKGSALEGAGVKQGFEAVSKATTVMGLSADEANGVFLALSQMMAKGKVSAEEFRGQLGERLPIATQVAAHALGVTTAEFSKMLDTGQLVSEEFLPKFFTALDKAVGKDAQDAAKSLSSEINRLATNWDLLKRNVADSEGLFGATVSGLVKTASDLTKRAGGLFANSEQTEELKAQGKVFDDLRAGVVRLKDAGIEFSQDFVTGIKGAFAAGRMDAKETIDAFSAYEKQLTALAAANIEKVREMSDNERTEQVKLVEQIAKEQEKRAVDLEKKTLSATDFVIRQAEREAAARRAEAGGNAGLLELVERELQIKLKEIRDAADAARIAGEAGVTSAVASEAGKRVGIEQMSAEAVSAAWTKANATKAAQSSFSSDKESLAKGGAIRTNSSGEFAFVSSWDENGNYIGNLGSSSSRPVGYADGGQIAGPGTGTSDSVLARVSNGEYVMRAASVERYGSGFMDAINRMSLPRFASGGPVGGRAPVASGVTIQNLNLPGVSNARQLVAELKQMLRTDPNLLGAGMGRPG